MIVQRKWNDMYTSVDKLNQHHTLCSTFPSILVKQPQPKNLNCLNKCHIYEKILHNDLEKSVSLDSNKITFESQKLLWLKLICLVVTWGEMMFTMMKTSFQSITCYIINVFICSIQGVLDKHEMNYSKFGRNQRVVL